MPGFDLKQINRNDQAILGAGILFLLLSFFAPFYGALIPARRLRFWRLQRHRVAQLRLPRRLADHHRRRDRRRAGVRQRLAADAAQSRLTCSSRASRRSALLFCSCVASPTSGHDVRRCVWGAWVLLHPDDRDHRVRLPEPPGGRREDRVGPDRNEQGRRAPAGGVVPPAAPYPPQGAAPSYPPAADYPPAAGSSDTPSV